MPDLPRLKPDPIPRIHAVPEYAATGELGDLYERTKAGFGVPWMGVVAMAFAHYPRFYEALWTALEPIAGTEAFTRACADLRSCAEQEASALSAPSILHGLRNAGYDDREIAEIRDCNDVFSSGNMPYLLMASLARSLLEGRDWSNDSRPGANLETGAGAVKPILIEAHHADPTIAALYADIRETLGLPFVNTDYRAFARWPSYFIPAWQQLKGAVKSAAYESHVARVHDHAATLAINLPNVTGLTSSDLVAMANRDASVDEVRDVVRLFQWLLPVLAVNVAFLRKALHS